MNYTAHYDSPLGGLFLAADEEGLTGLWFEDAAHFADGLPIEREETETPVLAETKKWLDLYFSGQEPEFLPKLHPMGSKFRQEVWALLREIPYGRTMTYGALAQELAQRQGRSRWRSHRAQSDLDPDPVPPRCGKQRKPDRIRGRAGEKSAASEAGRHCDRTLLLAGEKAGSCGEKEINCTQTTKDK